MATSGTYNFSSPQVREIIDEAYERAGILVTEITEQRIVSAIRSLNFVLQEWVSKGNNLWTIREGMIGLNANQNSYQMIANGIDIKTAVIRTSNRLFGGTPFSSAGGSAANCFDAGISSACSQTVPGGYISYSWNGSHNTVSMVGVQSNVTTEYTLAFDYSMDGATWLNALTVPTRTFNQGYLEWFSVPIPVPTSAFRVREIDSGTTQESWESITYTTWEEFLAPLTWRVWGAIVPLNLQEIYFNANLYDTTITRLSESEYTSLPNKNQVGRPTSYWVDRKIRPIIHLYPAPTSQYNNLYFTYWEAIQDVGTMLNNAEIPVRFVEAMTSALAYRLAMKEGKLDRIEILREESKEAYDTSASEDRERVPLRIYGDYMQGWTSV